MDSTSLAERVDTLVSAFKTALDRYAEWKRKKARQNHYRKQPVAAGARAAVGRCALSASLAMSATRVRETFDVGQNIIGSEFAKGDDICRDTISAQLWHFNSRAILPLEGAMKPPHGGQLDLNDMIQTSEAVRLRSVAALCTLYQCLAIGRPVPRELPMAKAYSFCPEDTFPDPYSSGGQPHPKAFDRRTAVWSTSSGPPVFQSEPPSPPLTPKSPGTEDIESVSARLESGAARHGRRSHQHQHRPARPKNSVFSIFCPEAMALQADPARAVPLARRCKCGFRWRVPELPKGRDAVLLKEGFRMTRRFLAKSHCDQRVEDEEDGRTATTGARPGRRQYGCVLCTSTGRTLTFETAEHLRVHVNGAHTKWQMLHDRDMA